MDGETRDVLLAVTQTTKERYHRKNSNTKDNRSRVSVVVGDALKEKQVKM